MTNGSYALARGQGEAIASISSLGWSALDPATASTQRAEKEGKKREDGRSPPGLDRLVLVREREGGVWRAATVALC